MNDKYLKDTYTRHITERLKNIKSVNDIKETCVNIKVSISETKEIISQEMKRNSRNEWNTASNKITNSSWCDQ